MDVAHGPDWTFNIHSATTDRTMLMFCFEIGQKARLVKTKSAITVQLSGALRSETEYRRKADSRQQDFVCQSHYVVSRLLNVHVKRDSQNTSRSELQASCSNSIKTWKQVCSPFRQRLLRLCCTPASVQRLWMWYRAEWWTSRDFSLAMARSVAFPIFKLSGRCSTHCIRPTSMHSHISITKTLLSQQQWLLWT